MLEENRDYQDEGCEIAPSCLKCPLPNCVHDEPRGKCRCRKRERNKEIALLHRKRGVKVGELACRFKISRRTVYRALAATTVTD